MGAPTEAITIPDDRLPADGRFCSGPAKVRPEALAALADRLRDWIPLDGRRVFYSWIGGTRSDWRGQGHFRALTEEQEVWAIENGFDEIVVKLAPEVGHTHPVYDAYVKHFDDAWNGAETL